MSKGYYHFTNLLYVVHLNLNGCNIGKIYVTWRNKGKGPISLKSSH